MSTDTSADPAIDNAPVILAPPVDTQSQPVDEQQPPKLDFVVVGIGASAGGLESYTEFLKAMPPDSGMAFVLIQHLSPSYESMLAEILSRHTVMPVLQVEDGMLVNPNTVYVIRPGHTMTIKDGRLHLGASLLAAGHRRPVDDFFRSLANEQRERAIAVILSGMGSNGTAGAQTVKAVGGFCIAEDPDAAKYPSMPRSLIESGLADAILRANEIPDAILRYARHPYASGKFTRTPQAPDDPKAINDVIAVLRARTRHDFSGYKRPTIVRRIERRMGLHQIENLPAYAKFVRQNPAEVSALADDLMIHVTGFFRDPEVWEAVRDRVIVPLVDARASGDSVRVWVTACSSGEEAYTLAILLIEATQAAGKKLDIKIFATDTAERSLASARSGVFPGGIESEVSAERLDRFFVKDDAFYHIKKEVRELVVFAPQNLLQDPPFSRLDICTCRNLLIYLEPEIQRRVMALVHFGLRDGGALVLGNSETVGNGVESLFEPIDKKLRIFRRVGPTRHGAIEFPLPYGVFRDVKAELHPDPRGLTRASVPQVATRILLEQYTPSAVAIDREGHIVYYHGDTSRFLDQPRGEPTRELLALARENIRGAVRTAIQHAIGQNDTAHVRDGTIETPAGRSRLEISVTPLEKRAIPSHFLVSFIERPEPPHEPDPEGHSEKYLQDELQRVRDELQSTIEELQSTNEEMKASTEETTSINEELQSTNEELETSKEELQSLNEELSTVNAQLQAKVEEVERTRNDLASLLSSTDIAVIFLDTQFRIRRFTPATRDLVELIPSDIGRPLNDLARKFVDPDLVSDTHLVLNRLVPIEKEISSKSERWYMRRVLPYRTADNRIDGVVITFVDITERRAALNAQHDLEDRLTWSVQASGIGHWEIEFPSRAFFCSPRAQELLGATSDQTKTYAGLLALIHADDREAFEEAVNRAINPAFGAPISVEFRTSHPDGGTLWLEARGAATFSATGTDSAPSRLRGIIADITQRKFAESALREAKRFAEAANEAKDQFLATVSHELRTPLAAILLWAKLMESDPANPEQREEGLRSIIRSAEAQRRLIEDLLDTARISAGKFRLEYRTVDLTQIIRAAVESALPLASSKDIRIEIDVATGANLVRVDADRIEQVLLNLLHNAVKFTPPGGIISVGLWRHGDEVEIRVHDNGLGIAPELLPLIFDRFLQGNSPASARTRGGLGLGLTICRQIVELHQGSISAASPGSGQGSTFTVRLPLPVTRNPAAINPSLPVSSDAVRGLNILLVEDDPTTSKAMMLLLSQLGANLTTAASAAEAFDAFEKNHPSIIVSDIGLPDADGYTLIRKIRTLEATRGQAPTPAIALSAYTHETDRRAAAESGFDQHIAKPVDPPFLLTTIVQVMGNR